MAASELKGAPMRAYVGLGRWEYRVAGLLSAALLSAGLSRSSAAVASTQRGHKPTTNHHKTHHRRKPKPRRHKPKPKPKPPTTLTTVAAVLTPPQTTPLPATSPAPPNSPAATTSTGTTTSTTPAPTLVNMLPTTPDPPSGPTPAGAQLQIVAITPSVTHANIGDLVTFTITAINNGPAAAPIDVEMAATTGLDWPGGDPEIGCGAPNGPTPNPGDGNLVHPGWWCVTAAAPTGSVVTDTVETRIAATNTVPFGSGTNTSGYATLEACLPVGADNASHCTRGAVRVDDWPVPDAHLAILSNTVSPSYAKVGQAVTFTIVAKNYGPDTVQLWTDPTEASQGLGYIPGTQGVTCASNSSAEDCIEAGYAKPGQTTTLQLTEQVTATTANYGYDTACAWSPDLWGTEAQQATQPDSCATAYVTIDKSP